MAGRRNQDQLLQLHLFFRQEPMFLADDPEKLLAQLLHQCDNASVHQDYPNYEYVIGLLHILTCPW